MEVTCSVESDWLFFSVLEGGLAAATVLVSFGVVIGKLSPLQLLLMGLVETVVFVINWHIGYNILGAIDGGMSYLTNKTSCGNCQVALIKLC